MKKYKNIIFDVGEVLLDYRWKDMLTKDYILSEETAEFLAPSMFSDPLWHEYDLWNLQDEDIIAAFTEKFPEHAAHIRWFIENGELMKVDRPRVWELVKQLKEAGYQLYILSNYPKSLFEKHMKDTAVLKLMDGVVVSYMIHKTKPEREIYDYLVETYQLNREECLFFDDRAENVEGSKEWGIDAKQVLSQEGLIKDLQDLLADHFTLE